ncbi:NAD(P)/FAD-dependent oxidoreductase [Siccirubricoccus deserti]
MRVAIIGAGVLGASTAFHLALAGAGVVVADQAHAGRATAAGAGIISPWSSGRVDPGWRRIAEAGARYYPTLIEQLAEAGEVETGYRRVGALSVAADHTELDQIERAVRARQAEAPEAGEVARLSPAEARALSAAAPGPRRGTCQRRGPRRWAAARRRAAAGGRAAGCALPHRPGRTAGPRRARDRDPAGLRGHRGGLRGRRGRGLGTGDAEAPRRFLAVVPQRGQITHLRLEGVDTGAWPVVLPRSSHYLLAFGGSRVVVGATRETGSGFDYRVTAAGQAEVLNEALAIAPGLGPATLVETRIGFRPVGPDLRPMLGRIAGLDGLVIGNGLGPSGLTIGPLAGRLLAQLVLGEAPELDLAAYDPLRLPGDAAGDGAEPVR